jgi:transposase
MITMEDWVTIKNLKSKKPEMGTRTLAKLLGISRNTVRNALASNNGPGYSRGEKVNQDIVPFESFIKDLHWQKRYKGSRILNEIKSKGYQGSQSAFYRFLKKIKVPDKRYFTPYETGPAEQAQFDWSPYTVLIDGVLTRIYVFTYICSFSRYKVLEVSLSANQGAVFEALENSIRECGGSVERVQTDNDRCFVTNPSKDHFQWNTRYLQFCGHYGFKPSRSLPGHPWSKGKVERPFSYIEDHFITGNEFESFEDLINKLKVFQDTCNEKVHGSTKVQPTVLFVKEKPSLGPLPEKRYVNVKEEIRKATFDCLISFAGSRYSVPWMFAGRMVWVKVSRGYFLHVYSESNKLVACHRLSLEKGKVIINKDHYRGIKNDTGNWERLKILFLERYPGSELFLEKLQAQKRINSRYHLGRILEIGSYYQREYVLEVIKLSLDYNVFNYSFFLGYLEKHYQHTIDIQQTSDFDYRHPLNKPIVRDLNEYRLGGPYES